MQTEILTEEQYKKFSKSIIKAIGERCRIVPINSLKNHAYRLNRPIYVTVEMDANTIIASLDDIEAFFYADTEFEAINGLCEEIVALYEDLRKNRDDLGVLPKKWLEYLDEAIIVHEKN